MRISLCLLAVFISYSSAQDGFPTLRKVSATSDTLVFGYSLNGDKSKVVELRVTVTASDTPDISKDEIVDLSKDEHTLTNLRSNVEYKLFPQTLLKSGSVLQGLFLTIKTNSLPAPKENEKEEDGPSVGVIVGIVVGSIIGLALLVAAFIIGFRCSKNNKKTVEYRACDSTNYTGDDKSDPNKVEINAQWEDVDQLLESSSKPPQPKPSQSKPPQPKRGRTPQPTTDTHAPERAPMNSSETHEPTTAVKDAPAGYRRSYVDADVIPRGPSLKYRESLREVTRDKYRNIVRKDRIAEDDDSDDDDNAWYQNANGGKRYPQKSYPAPRPSGYAQPTQSNYIPNKAPAQPPPVQSKGQGKRLPNLPPAEQGPPGYSENSEFRSRVAQRYGEDESAV